MLSPTHEEEITTLVANTVQSYKDLPLRLYQISKSSEVGTYIMLTPYSQKIS